MSPDFQFTLGLTLFGGALFLLGALAGRIIRRKPDPEDRITL